jgi:hypothetical protein
MSIAPQLIVAGHRPLAAEEMIPWTPYMRPNDQGNRIRFTPVNFTHTAVCHETRIFNATTNYLAQFFFPPQGPFQVTENRNRWPGHAERSSMHCFDTHSINVVYEKT